MLSKRIVAICTVFILFILSISGTSEATAVGTISSNLNTGPYVDRLVYKVIANQDQRVLAMQAGEIEMDTSFFDKVHYNTLAVDPDFNLYRAIRNGYGHITINCRDAPLNESVLRRAFAFAYDKTAVTADIFDGFSEEHDSLVPLPNGWCAEDEFDWHYYAAQPEIGNQLLDASGLFPINGSTGYRTYKGQPFDIKIGYAASSPEIAGGCTQLGADALTALHIDAEKVATDTNEYISTLDGHGYYDMVFYALNFYSNDVDWLAYEYWSEYADVPYQNPTNFKNATYDSWRDQLLYGTTYEDVYNAAAEMQKILHYNVPRLVVYENTYLQAYRNDRYTGHVEDFGRYITGPWTMRKIHRIDGRFGGTVPIAISEEVESFNIFLTHSAYGLTLTENLYSSLFKYGPDCVPVGDLAESMITEIHSDNPAVPDGHTRYTIDIIQNATWSDGVPLTAEDIAFTFTYYAESGIYGNPAGTYLYDLVAVYAPSTYCVIIEYSTESYWHFSTFAFDKIIPEHIFNDEDGIGYEGWDSWNPVFNPSHPHVTSGPFIVTDYEAGEWYELSANPLFYYRAPNPAPEISPTNNVIYVYGTTGNVIIWEVSDDNPLTYVVIKDLDVTPVASGFWDGSDISVNVDGLEIGTYEYTLGLSDYSGNFAYDSVTVSVVTETTNSDTTTTDGNPIEWSIVSLVISVGSLSVILVVIVLIYKTKQP